MALHFQSESRYVLDGFGPADIVHTPVTYPACSGKWSQRPGWIVNLARAAFADSKAETHILSHGGQKILQRLEAIFFIMVGGRGFNRGESFCLGKIFLLKIITADIVNYQNWQRGPDRSSNCTVAQRQMLFGKTDAN